MKHVFYALLALALALLGARLASTPAMAEGPSSPRDSGESQQQEKELPTYTPSEKVPAGSAVSFPVDI